MCSDSYILGLTGGARFTVFLNLTMQHFLNQCNILVYLKNTKKHLMETKKSLMNAKERRRKI